jgi:sulfur carrier protein ThiS
MKVKITDEMENDREEEIIIEKTSVKDILKRLDIDPFEAIVMKKGEIILESDIITNEDEIKIINVIHGG